MDRWLKSGCFKRKRTISDVDVEEEQTSSYDDIEPTNEVPTSKVSNLNPNVNSVPTTVSSGSKIRKYDSEYLHLGFTYIGSEDKPRPQCVICLQVLSNEGMKPAKLRRHLDTKHPECKSKSVEFFKLKLVELKKSQNVMKQTSLNINENATLASYQVSEPVSYTHLFVYIH